MRLVVLLAVAAVVAIAVWRSRHGVEVWHMAADVPSVNLVKGP
jgi:hypothetical protein